MKFHRTIRLSLRSILVALVFVASQHAVVEAACKSVAKIPFRIKKPGVYCFKKSLSVKNKVLPISGGASGNAAAIVIQADGVILDLQEFVLDGTSFGPATELVGIYSDGWSDVIVRNGTVRGFQTGIGLFTGDDLTVEGIRARSNTVVGLRGFGSRVTIRDNEVTGTGPSPNSHAATGIAVGGFSTLVADNYVAETIARQVDFGFGISANGDGFVVNNRISVTDNGVDMSGTQKYRDNLTNEVTIPYTGGIDAGNNN